MNRGAEGVKTTASLVEDVEMVASREKDVEMVASREEASLSRADDVEGSWVQKTEKLLGRLLSETEDEGGSCEGFWALSQGCLKRSASFGRICELTDRHLLMRSLHSERHYSTFCVVLNDDYAIILKKSQSLPLKHIDTGRGLVRKGLWFISHFFCHLGPGLN